MNKVPHTDKDFAEIEREADFIEEVERRTGATIGEILHHLQREGGDGTSGRDQEKQRNIWLRRILGETK